MKYKVGEKIKIIEIEVLDEYYLGDSCDDYLDELGIVIEVKEEVTGYFYLIKFDNINLNNRKYYWHENQLNSK